MAIEFRLPDVGEGIATAEIVAWQVAEGDRVSEHQDLVEIQTDKATVVIPCPADGVITRLCGEPGDTLDVGSVLAVIEADGASANGGSTAPAGAAAATPRAPARAHDGEAETDAGAPAAPRAGPPLAAPTTRRLARDL
ncbi:MAG TPA: biotin/lipoyl-containing protein, partial [Solirubrobacteraceae bacterium]